MNVKAKSNALSYQPCENSIPLHNGHQRYNWSCTRPRLIKTLTRTETPLSLRHKNPRGTNSLEAPLAKFHLRSGTTVRWKKRFMTEGGSASSVLRIGIRSAPLPLAVEVPRGHLGIWSRFLDGSGKSQVGSKVPSRGEWTVGGIVAIRSCPTVNRLAGARPRSATTRFRVSWFHVVIAVSFSIVASLRFQ